MPKKESSAEVTEQRERLGRGDQLTNGYCFDPDRDPDIFKCGPLEEGVAKGEISVSWDGSIVQNLVTGEVERREARPMTASTMIAPVNAPTAGGASTTATTDNAPAGGRGART